MKNTKEILRLASDGNFTIRQIAKSCSCSPSTVTTIIERAKNAEIALDWPMINNFTESELESKLYPPEIHRTDKPLPDMNFIHKELKKKGVTLQLLWQEYIEKNPDGVRYSMFCDHYRKWRELRNVSMHQIHKAGEKGFVDWVGQTMGVINRETGDIQPAYLFVGALGASDFFYTEAFPSMTLEYWIKAHINMFNYFGGVPEIIVPDNLKTGVKKPSYYEPEIHPTYLDMARYYDTVIIPARVRKPKDKPIAENTVLLVERWICAKYRNHQFFSFYELNSTIRRELDRANSTPFQKMEGSRKILFETIEKHLLKPLPMRSYELATFKIARVNIDYHIEFDGNYYSVPYQLIKQEIEIRATTSIVEILHNGSRVAIHSRVEVGNYRYTTLPEHMPDKHRCYSEWNDERIIHWAESIGPNTASFVEHLMNAKQHSEQSYRACMGVISLGKKFNTTMLEKAAGIALDSKRYSYRSVKSIIETLPVGNNSNEENPIVHKNIRGASYYSQEVQ